MLWLVYWQYRTLYENIESEKILIVAYFTQCETRTLAYFTQCKTRFQAYFTLCEFSFEILEILLQNSYKSYSYKILGVELEAAKKCYYINHIREAALSRNTFE